MSNYSTLPLELRELLTDDGTSPFGRWFESLDVLLLGGGRKRDQWRDVERALSRWHEYKRSKARR